MKQVLVLLSLSLSLLSPALAQSDTGPSTDREPENLAYFSDRLVKYHDFGEYGLQIRRVANAARDFLIARTRETKKGEKLVAIFDIDETSLSNWDAMKKCGFCIYTLQEPLPGVAITPVLELFNAAKRHGVEVYFLTGRPDAQRASTMENLSAVGYSGWTGLIMRPPGNLQSAADFKSAQRLKLTSEQGVTIILNIGDQASDLTGCCAEQVFKIPNPFYLIQ